MEFIVEMIIHDTSQRLARSTGDPRKEHGTEGLQLTNRTTVRNDALTSLGPDEPSSLRTSHAHKSGNSFRIQRPNIEGIHAGDSGVIP